MDVKAQTDRDNYSNKWTQLPYLSPLTACRLLSWRTEKVPHFINISDIALINPPLCPVDKETSHEPDFTS